jgi:DMSO/TMAO reductase YedYZ molybdopterin-dependent catalytic subunit
MVMNAGRSVHGAPKHARDLADHPVLNIDGLVARPRALTPDDLDPLPRRRFLDLRVDHELTFLPETDWSGVLLRDLLELAGPLVDARWVRISAGPYATIAALAELGEALLCDRIEGGPIPVEKGGPWRLVLPDARYNMSVKWVDTLTVTAEEPDNSAVRIAAARQRARDAHARRG